MLVFDERRPIDTVALRGDPVFGAAETRLLPAATMLVLPLPADRALRLSRNAEGWTVTAGDEPALRPIRPEPDTGAEGVRLRLASSQPGRSVTVPDPLTGGTLLVGTQHEPGQGIAVPHATPEFTLLPTWQGVALAAVSDELVLREATDGFMLGSAQPRRALVLAKADTDLGALDDAARLTRRFDLPGLPVPALLQRLQGAAAGCGAEPAGLRTAPRIAAAQAMLALGLGVEAQAVLSVAASSDPRAEDDPDLLGLSAVAALIAGRPQESAALDDPRLTGTDEVALWRGLRAAMLREGAPAAAAVLAAEYRLLLAYPPPLQARLLPLAAETMALGGEADAAQRLVDARPHDTGLDFARALLAEQRDRPAALALLDRMAQSPDRLVRARAAPRAVELRLAAGQLTPAGAADAMEKLLFTWRGDGREVALRLRAAELRAQAGAPRAALPCCAKPLKSLPDAQDTLRAGMQTIFSAALAADRQTPLPPLELVAMAEENPDLIAEGEPGLALARTLADRLAALDLPRRAAPVLEKLVAAAQPGVVRAELGGRLAGMRVLLGDPAGALSVARCHRRRSAAAAGAGGARAGLGPRHRRPGRRRPRRRRAGGAGHAGRAGAGQPVAGAVQGLESRGRHAAPLCQPQPAGRGPADRGAGRHAAAPGRRRLAGRRPGNAGAAARPRSAPPAAGTYRRHAATADRDAGAGAGGSHPVAARGGACRRSGGALRTGALPRTLPGALPLDPTKGFALGTRRLRNGFQGPLGHRAAAMQKSAPGRSIHSCAPPPFFIMFRRLGPRGRAHAARAHQAVCWLWRDAR